MQEMMASSVINQLTSAVVEFSAIARIRKYRGLHEEHHFIPMAMEVHDTLGCDMDHFIRECACFFHNRQLRDHLFVSFCIQFLKQCVRIALLHALASAIKRKIALVGDVCFRPPITIRYHNLRVGDIRGVVGEITSYQ